ncbi:hypothetical protein Trydic_g6408 [Trypoxylus dichotomus]
MRISNENGHVIDPEGLHPAREHIAAIEKMLKPTNTLKESSFKWTTADEALFNKLKQILTSNDTLVFYDPNLSLVVISDASDKGTEAVLFHTYADGGMRPVAFASRTFSEAETRYSTIDKEALGIIFAITSFRHYLYGRHFTLFTAHKPLQRIFSKERETLKIASNRPLRWAMILNSYDYEIAYHPGEENAPADVLSRLRLKDKNMTSEEEVDLPNVPPAVRLVKFYSDLRSAFDQIKSDIFHGMDSSQQNQNRIYDRGARDGVSAKHQPVWVNNTMGKGSSPGRIIQQTDAYSYVVDVNGNSKRKHGNQLKSCMEPEVGCPVDMEKVAPTPTPLPSIELTKETVPIASIEKPLDMERPDERDQSENQNPKPELENRVQSTDITTLPYSHTEKKSNQREAFASRYRE